MIEFNENSICDRKNCQVYLEENSSGIIYNTPGKRVIYKLPGGTSLAFECIFCIHAKKKDFEYLLNKEKTKDLLKNKSASEEDLPF